MALTHYELDPVHSQLGFSVRHLMITRVHGVFARWSGSFALDHDDPSGSKVSVDIEAASVDTRNAQRDGHLKSADFFDVEHHPTIRFVAKQISREGQLLRLAGEFTVRGVTRPVSFEVVEGGSRKDSQGRLRRGYRATAAINRHDFGVAWNQVYEGGAVVVGDTVDLVLDLQLIPR